MIESEFGFQFLILLLDRPPLMGRLHERSERRGGGQVANEVPVVGGGGGGAGWSLTEQPHVGQALVVTPQADGRDANRDNDIGLHRHWLDPTIPFAATLATPASGLLVTSATLRDGGEGGARPGGASGCAGRPRRMFTLPAHRRQEHEAQQHDTGTEEPPVAAKAPARVLVLL